MTIRRFALASTPTAFSGAVLAILAVAGVGVIATANTEAVVAKRFVAALENPVAQRTPDRVAEADGDKLVSGSEAYWLAERQRIEADGASVEPATWSAPLAAGLSVGDRITIPNGKTERVLQVVAIADVEPAPGSLQTGNGTPSLRQIAITCRDLSANGHDGQLVTFVVPAGNSLASSGKAPQTL